MHERARKRCILSPLTHLPSMLCVLMKILHVPVRKRRQKAQGFQVLRFYSSFSTDTMAVKGLMFDYCGNRTVVHANVIG